MRKTRLLLSCSIAALAVALSGAAAQAGSALIYGWENGVEGWTTGGAKTLANSSTFGVTQGSQSLVLHYNGPGTFSQDTVATVGSGSAFNAWKQAATRLFAGDSDVKLEFDFSHDDSNAGGIAYAQLGIFLNSTDVGFTQYGTGQLIGGNIGQDFPRLDPAAVTDGVTLTPVDADTVHVAIPLGVRVGVGGPSSTFYQVAFQTNGGWPGTVDWAFDNMRITGANIVPEPASATLAGLLGLGLIAGLRRRS